MKSILTLALVMTLAGCINTQHSSDRTNSVAALNADGLVCKREKPTGSHRSVKICRTVGEIERDRKEAEEMSRRVRTQAQIN